MSTQLKLQPHRSMPMCDWKWPLLTRNCLPALPAAFGFLVLFPCCSFLWDFPPTVFVELVFLCVFAEGRCDDLVDGSSEFFLRVSVVIWLFVAVESLLYFLSFRTFFPLIYAPYSPTSACAYSSTIHLCRGFYWMLLLYQRCWCCFHLNWTLRSTEEPQIVDF